MQIKYLNIQKSARYITLGQPSAALQQIFYLFHGYGQLATSFLEEFSYVANGSRYFIAPEGLSRFYLSGGSGKVGASWMTREERSSEIIDYLNFLDTLHNTITNDLNIMNIQIILLGFSQGVATACRWLETLTIPVSKLIIWAGTMPPDVDLWRIKSHYPDLEVYLVAGIKDPLISSDLLKEEEERLEKANLHYRKIRFDGKHELHPPTLSKLI
jgi:predicted esterase